jgi:tetratricopeptide (TPR) repeat protein
MDVFERVLHLDPDHLTACYYLAELYEASGHTPVALDYLERIALLDPLDSFAAAEIERLTRRREGSLVEPDRVEVKVLDRSGQDQPIGAQEGVTVVDDEMMVSRVEMESHESSVNGREMEASDREVECRVPSGRDVVSEVVGRADSTSVQESVDEGMVEGDSPTQQQKVNDLYGEKEDLAVLTSLASDVLGHQTASLPEKGEAPERKKKRSSRKGKRGDTSVTKLFEEIETDAAVPMDEAPGGPVAPTQEEIATLTLAEVYAAQGLLDRSIEILELLLAKHPEDLSLVEKLEEVKMKKLSRNEGGKGP